MKTVTKLSILTALVLTFFVSCNPNGAGIFYSISTEVKINNSVLSDKAVYKIVYANSKLYVLAGRAVYYHDGSTWKKIAAPSGKPYAVSLAAIGSIVLAVYEDDSVSPLADSLYSLDGNGTTWSEAPGTSAISDSDGIQLVTVDHDSSIVFVSVQTATGVSPTYHIYSYKANTLTPLTSTDISLPLAGAAVLSGPTYFLAASESTGNSALYSTNGNSTLAPITPTGFSTSKTIGGISEDSGTATLYLSTKDGYLYSSTNGTAWTLKNSTALTDGTGTGAQLGDMTEVTFNSVNYLIIAGNTGYYEWNLASGTPAAPTVTAADFSTYDLSKEMVYSLLSTSADSLYLGSAQGLWESSYSSGDVTLNQK